MVARRGIMAIAVIAPAMLVGRDAFGQDPSPSEGDVSRIIYRFKNALTKADSEALFDLFPDDHVYGLGHEGEKLTSKRIVVEYLKSFPNRVPLSVRNVISIEAGIVCAVFDESFAQSSIPITGRSWLFVFSMRHSQRGFLISRMNVIEIA